MYTYICQHQEIGQKYSSTTLHCIYDKTITHTQIKFEHCHLCSDLKLHRGNITPNQIYSYWNYWWLFLTMPLLGTRFGSIIVCQKSGWEQSVHELIKKNQLLIFYVLVNLFLQLSPSSSNLFLNKVSMVVHIEHTKEAQKDGLLLTSTNIGSATAKCSLWYHHRPTLHLWYVTIARGNLLAL
jgi:hypothetical protein